MLILIFNTITPLQIRNFISKNMLENSYILSILAILTGKMVFGNKTRIKTRIKIDIKYPLIRRNIILI